VNERERESETPTRCNPFTAARFPRQDQQRVATAADDCASLPGSPRRSVRQLDATSLASQRQTTRSPFLLASTSLICCNVHWCTVVLLSTPPLGPLPPTSLFSHQYSAPFHFIVRSPLAVVTDVSATDWLGLLSSDTRHYVFEIATAPSRVLAVSPIPTLPTRSPAVYQLAECCRDCTHTDCTVAVDSWYAVMDLFGGLSSYDDCLIRNDKHLSVNTRIFRSVAKECSDKHLDGFLSPKYRCTDIPSPG